jgi:hypothetical protein
MFGSLTWHSCICAFFNRMHFMFTAKTDVSNNTITCEEAYDTVPIEMQMTRTYYVTWIISWMSMI